MEAFASGLHPCQPFLGEVLRELSEAHAVSHAIGKGVALVRIARELTLRTHRIETTIRSCKRYMIKNQIIISWNICHYVHQAEWSTVGDNWGAHTVGLRAIDAIARGAHLDRRSARVGSRLFSAVLIKTRTEFASGGSGSRIAINRRGEAVARRLETLAGKEYIGAATIR